MAGRADVLPALFRAELMGYVHDALAFYYFRDRKYAAALYEVTKALKCLTKRGLHESLAIARLHEAAIQQQMGQFKLAHRGVYDVIGMVMEGELAFEESSPRQLCIVAVAYHNLAVVQLKLEISDIACKNSMNARKIARLCLSYSNRWLDTFQYTHECALEDAKFQLSQRNQHGLLDERQTEVMDELTEAMFESTLG